MAGDLPLITRLSADGEVELREDLEYRSDPALGLDLHLPAGDGGGPRPAVLFVHGDGPPEYLEGIKSSAQYAGWGRLAAASGLVGVTFDHRSTHGWTRIAEPAEDVERAVSFVRERSADLGIDGDRLAVWSCSAGPPVVLPTLLREPPPYVRCLAVCYGVMDLEPAAERVEDAAVKAALRAASPLEALRASGGNVPPMLIARAGADNPRLNRGLDRFIAEALALNAPVEVINLPEGDHGFEVRNDDARSSEAVRRTVEFMKHHTG
ncbi:MAG: alpha/beta hydrolase [Acidobacteriota bacterium]|jgi:acetyl esterase/lipase